MNHPARLTRRGLLAVAATACAALAGCAGSGSARTESTSSAATTAAGEPAGGGRVDDRARATRALQQEQATLASYRRIAEAHPGLSGQIRELERVQRRHIQALADALGTPGAAADGPGVSPQIGRQPDPRATVARLARTMRRLRLRDCDHAVSGSLASLMASMAASHAMVVELWGRRR